MPAWPSSDHPDVLELPGIVAVEVFREQALAVEQWGPVAANADNLAEIGPCDFKDAFEVHFVGFDNALARMLDRPNNAGQHRRCYLERGRVVVRRHPTRFVDRELRAVPIDTS